MKKISDEAAAGIFCFVWVFFMYLALFIELGTGSNIGWYIFLLDTVVQITMLVYEAKVERLEKQLQRTRANFARQTADYVEYIRTHETAESEKIKRAEIIKLDKYFRKGRKRKGA